jgi:hypothetical protein
MGGDMSKKHLLSFLVAPLALILTLMAGTYSTFADSKLTPSFDTPKAVPRIFQPAYVPFSEQLKAYVSLADFSDFGVEAKAIKQFKIVDQKQSDFRSFSPTNCLGVIQLAIYQTNWEDPANPFKKSLGDGSKAIYQYDVSDAVGAGELFFGLFADKSSSKTGLIGDFTKSLKNCSSFKEKARYEDIAGSLRLTTVKPEHLVIDFETSYGKSGHSKGFVSFFQVGRNMLFAGNVFRNDDGKAGYEFSSLERQEVLSLQRALAADLVFQSKRKDQ